MNAATARFKNMFPRFAENRPGRPRLRIAGIAAAIGLGLLGMYEATRSIGADVEAVAGVAADVGHQWQPVDSTGNRAYAPGYGPVVSAPDARIGLTATEVVLASGAVLALGGAAIGLRRRHRLKESAPLKYTIAADAPVQLGRPPKPAAQPDSHSPGSSDSYHPSANRLTVLYPNNGLYSVATYDTRAAQPSTAVLQMHPGAARVDTDPALAYA